MKELSINTNINLYFFCSSSDIFENLRQPDGCNERVEELCGHESGCPAILYNLQLEALEQKCNCKVCPAILYNYLHWQRPGPAFTAGLYNYSCSAIDCNAMAEHLSQQHFQTLQNIKHTCKVASLQGAQCMHHALYTVQCMCNVHGAYRLCNLTPNPIKSCQQIKR